MKRVTEIVKVEKIVSDVLPDVSSTRLEFAPAFEWADKRKTPWLVVSTNKSYAYGARSTIYGPATHSRKPEDIAMRIAIFHDFCEGGQFARSIWRWSARFTLAHYREDGFRGGTFQQFARWAPDGGVYSRSSLNLDYTPSTLSKVVDTFQEWAEKTFTDTTKITIGQEIVREYGAAKTRAKNA